MTTMPGKKEFRSNLQEMLQLELAQADLLAEILQMLTEAKHEKIRALCQRIHQDELLHAQQLENLLALP